MENQIEIYQTGDGQTQIEVTFEQDAVWLTNAQLVKIFDSSKENISEHITHIFNSEELDEKSTVRNFRTVQKEGSRKVERNRMHYNLDVIIAVGYRLNSKQGTQFRQWATQRLRDYLVQGYAINEKRLAQKQQEIQTPEDGIRILSRVVEGKLEETNVQWLEQFAERLELLDDYDHEQLDKKGLTIRQAIYRENAEYRSSLI